MKKLLSLLLLPLLAACGAAANAQAPTPTPLPPAPALERPSYTVQRGAVERVLEATGRVTPVDMERLAFQASGRVAELAVRRGDAVRAGDVLAELLHEDELAALAQAEVRVAQAERDLELARQRREREVEQAEIDLGETGRGLERARADRAARVAEAEQGQRRAEADLAALLAGGPASLIEQAERGLAQAQEQAKRDSDAASEAKTRAEHGLIQAAEAIQQAQQAYSDAFWDLEWVNSHGTHPREKVADPETGAQRQRRLEPHERTQFERAFAEAERALREAERALPLAERDVALTREAELQAVAAGEQAVADARRALDLLRAGQGNETLTQAQRRVEDAKVALEEARRGDTAAAEASLARSRLGLQSAEQDSLDAEQSALDDARLDLEQARRKVDAGRVIAPRDGTIVALAIGEGDTVEAYEPVVELADPSRLEVAAELSAEQMRELAEGQPAALSLVARPGIVISGTIRLMPAPYGSGGSGAVAEQDRTTRFSLDDGDAGWEAAGGKPEPGAVAQILVVIERKEDVLWLPPEAIRSFEGRSFVVVREGDRERRAPVRTGIETTERVEILEGVEEGAVVVGQ
jgi:HlyD family secretion protein